MYHIKNTINLDYKVCYILKKVNINTIIIYLLFSSLNVFCQVNQADTTIQNYLRKGRFALMFQITENFKLSDFQGALISGKYHLSQKSAISLGVGLDGYYSETNNKYLFVDTLAYAPYTVKDVLTLNFLIKYMYYFKPVNRISLYFA